MYRWIQGHIKSTQTISIMKKMISAAALFLPLSLLAQDVPFEVKGTIADPGTPSRAYLYYRVGADNFTDSAEVDKGAFVIKGKVPAPLRGTLVVRPLPGSGKAFRMESLGFYLEKGTLQVSSDKGIGDAKVSGGPLNADYTRLQEATKSAKAQYQEAGKAFAAADEATRNSEAFKKSQNEKYDAIRKEEKASLLAFVKANTASPVALDALQQYAGSMPDDVKEIEGLLHSFAAPVQNSVGGKAFAKTINGWKNTAIGAQAPEFAQNDTEGKPVKLTDFRGKYVLIDFWASWCGPCRAENPHVVKAYEKYKSKNFEILGVSLDEPTGRAAWLKAIEDDKLTWTQVSDLKFWDNEAAKLYGVRGIPQNFLLDPKGKIIARNLRGDALEAKLAEVLTN